LECGQAFEIKEVNVFGETWSRKKGDVKIEGKYAEVVENTVENISVFWPVQMLMKTNELEISSEYVVESKIVTENAVARCALGKNPYHSSR